MLPMKNVQDDVFLNLCVEASKALKVRDLEYCFNEKQLEYIKKLCAQKGFGINAIPHKNGEGKIDYWALMRK